MAPAVPRPAEPAISLCSDPAISRHARRVLPYVAGVSYVSSAVVDMDNMEVGGLIGAACRRLSSRWFNCLAMLPRDRPAWGI